MVIDYIHNDYLRDLGRFYGDGMPSHGSFGMLCGMTMTHLFAPKNRMKFISPEDFLCCLYALNLINQGLHVYYPEIHDEWLSKCLPFIDNRGCSAAHGGWTSEPYSILRIAKDPSNISKAKPVEIRHENLKGYIEYFMNDSFGDIFDTQSFNSQELIKKLKTDPSCYEINDFI